MKKLKEVVDKQRDEIRAKDRELGLRNEDVEAVSDEPLPRVHPPGSTPEAPWPPSLTSKQQPCRGPSAKLSLDQQEGTRHRPVT